MSRRRASLWEIGRLFAKLGTTAFGGPAAHVAMMEDEVVRRRGWLTHEQFLDYLSAANLIPGPNSTEPALHIGHARGGWPGLVVAGVSFVVPAAAMVGIIAWAYVTYGALPQASGILRGVAPVVLAVVGQALWGLGRSAVKSAELAVLAVVAIAAVAAGVHELLVLLAAGCAWGLMSSARRTASAVVVAAGLGTATSAVGAMAAAAATTMAPVSLWTVFLLFGKIGAVLFGSGYVLLAYVRADFVVRLGWLTEQQLLDAIAVGQVTPGPVFTTATFIGYLLAGVGGASVATLGIFLPAFVFVAASGPLVPRLRRSPAASAALDAINVASLALMAVVSWQLGMRALVDPFTIALAALSLVALVRFRVNSAWLVLGGGLAGMMQ